MGQHINSISRNIHHHYHVHLAEIISRCCGTFPHLHPRSTRFLLNNKQKNRVIYIVKKYRYEVTLYPRLTGTVPLGLQNSAVGFGETDL